MIRDYIHLHKNKIIWSVITAAADLCFIKTGLQPEYDGGSVFYNLLYSISISQLTDVFIFIGLALLIFVFSCRVRGLNRPYLISAGVLSVFFSAMIPVGRSFRNADSTSLITSSHIQIIKSLISFAGYFLFFYVIISLLFLLFEHLKISFHSEDEADAFSLFIQEHFFIFFLLLLFLTVLIYLFVMPGFLMGDTASQIFESFGINAYYFPASYPYIYADSTLTNMHPIFSTLYIHFCLLFGKAVFGSYNSGLYVAAVIQFSTMVFVIARSCNVLAQINIKGRYILAYLTFIYVNPFILSYMFVFTKDVPYTAFLFLFMIELFLAFTGRETGTDIFLTILSALGTAAFRGEGLYLVLILLAVSVPFFIIRRASLRKIIFSSSMFLGIILIHLAWTGIVFPILHVSPAVKTIQLTIPMQQVGRYVCSGGELTEEEHEAINSVLDIEMIKTSYDPSDGDSLKKIFRHDCSEEELEGFIRAWMSVATKKPGIALDAWFNTKYEFFYLENTYMSLYSSPWSQSMMSSINERVQGNIGLELGLSYPQNPVLTRMRMIGDCYFMLIRVLPVLNVFMMPGFYVLLLLIITIFLFVNRSSRGILMMTSLWFIFFTTNMLSAVNASYGRYLYPIMLILPFVFLTSMKKTADQ